MRKKIYKSNPDFDSLILAKCVKTSSLFNTIISTKYVYVCEKCKIEFGRRSKIISHISNEHKVPRNIYVDIDEEDRPLLITDIKPWKDPESLFCDGTFLKKLIGKEPTEGEECRGNNGRK